MTDINQVEEDSTSSREIWPGRFLVRAEVDYRDRKGKNSTLHEIFFQSTMSNENAEDLLLELGFQPGCKGFSRLVSQAKDTFSEQQAEELVTYLNERRGTRAYSKPAFKPMYILTGASALPSLPSMRDRSVYKLYLEPGYSLNFKVEAVNMKTYIAMSHLFQELHEQEEN